LTKRRDKRGPARAELFLRKMEELYKFGEMDMKSDVITYTTIINAWTKKTQ
jgi:hypothetical protein